MAKFLMKNLRTLIALWLMFMFCFHVKAQEVWTVGPMIHVNFGEKRTVSWALEVAYWNIASVPHSVDFGFEFDRKKTRIYSELQTGIGVTGISAGPVFQFGKDSGAKLGFQGTAWINYYLGADFRMRFFRNEKKTIAVGTYLKLPVATSGLDDGDGDDWDSDWD